jgi:nucleotide-binding universal stress UspA family protein
MTPIMSYGDAHRAVRVIYRGDFLKIQQDAEEEHHHLRRYLAATDLSEESTHALEWAVGTVLRDGDTLIAIYCVDEEAGIVTGDHVLVPDDPKAMKEQAAALADVTVRRTPPVPSSAMFNVHHQPSALARAINITHAASSPTPSHRDRTKAELERHRAVEEITERVTKLLRKTRLQVKVIVEVLHCKNPKHMITEVIDTINPTLVVLGSRGRSALNRYVAHPRGVSLPT